MHSRSEPVRGRTSRISVKRISEPVYVFLMEPTSDFFGLLADIVTVAGAAVTVCQFLLKKYVPHVEVRQT